MIQQFLGFHGFSFDDAGHRASRSASGVPRVTAELRQMTERYFGFHALVLEPGVRTGMPILYDNPKEVGADRIANAVGAYDLYGGPTIVVDFGTANTDRGDQRQGRVPRRRDLPRHRDLDGRAVRARRRRCGGSSSRAPKNVIGKSTVESIQSGAVYGFSGQVDGARRPVRGRARRVHGRSRPAGSPSSIIPHSRTIQHYEPWLTLHGLRIIFERNQ